MKAIEINHLDTFTIVFVKEAVSDPRDFSHHSSTTGAFNETNKQQLGLVGIHLYLPSE
jgi:hypothetical protein